jgi:hypothetical protein
METTMFTTIHSDDRPNQEAVLFESKDYGDVLKKLQLGLEIVKDPGEHGLPHLNISWTPVLKVGDTYYVCEQITYTFMNFRRYGWSWAPGKDAQQGYGSGPIYANRTDGGVTCHTPEQVVRDNLILAMAEFCCQYQVPDELVYGVGKVKEAWNWLLEDALENITQHANNGVHATNGCISDNVKVTTR